MPPITCTCVGTSDWFGLGARHRARLPESRRCVNGVKRRVRARGRSFCALAEFLLMDTVYVIIISGDPAARFPPSNCWTAPRPMPTKKATTTTNAAGAKRVTRSAAAAPAAAVRPKQLYRKDNEAPKPSKGDSDKEKCAHAPIELARAVSLIPVLHVTLAALRIARPRWLLQRAVAQLELTTTQPRLIPVLRMTITHLLPPAVLSSLRTSTADSYSRRRSRRASRPMARARRSSRLSRLSMPTQGRGSTRS